MPLNTKAPNPIPAMNQIFLFCVLWAAQEHFIPTQVRHCQTTHEKFLGCTGALFSVCAGMQAMPTFWVLIFTWALTLGFILGATQTSARPP